MEDQREKKTRKEGSGSGAGRRILMVTTVGTILLCLLVGWFALFQMHRYEDGVLEVCAKQQDAYVQLVVDQINLKENRTDEKIISEILATLDASTNKYWTFSDSDTMLFVKDVLETNKYKGFTSATYYDSASAKKFWSSLREGRVIHADITIGEKQFIASGTAFSYKDKSYRLCLLSNRSIFLNNNAFLGAKTELTALIAVVLCLLMILPMFLALKVSRLQKKTEEQGEIIVETNHSLSKMNQMLSQRRVYDPQNMVWQMDMLDVFLKKLKERKAAPLVQATIVCDSRKTAEEMLRQASLVLDRRVLRFEKEQEVVLLFTGYEKGDAMAVLRLFLGAETRLSQLLVLEEGGGVFRHCETERMNGNQ